MKEASLTLPNSDGRPWYREPWPWILMAGPALVIVAGLITAWLAWRSNDGLVADDYYKQGLAVNQVLERDKQALELGLRANVMRSGRLLRIFLAAAPTFVPPAAVTLKVMHPTRGGEDQTILLLADGGGFYSGKLLRDLDGRRMLALEDASGRWRLYGSWEADAPESQMLVAGEESAKLNRSFSRRK